jgi:ADP-ribosylation factor-like protein 2
MTESVDKRLMGASLMVFKNKSDVSDAMSEDEVREVGTQQQQHHHHHPRIRAFPCLDSGFANVFLLFQGLQLSNISTHRWVIRTCSAVTGDGLQPGMEWVVEDAKSRLFLF